MDLVRCYIIIGFVLFLQATSAQDGSLDPSFGDNGVFILSNNDAFEYGEGLAQFNDGKIITAGYMLTNQNETGYYFAKFTPDGQLDPSFGDNGILLGDPFVEHHVGPIYALNDNSYYAGMDLIDGTPSTRYIKKFLPDGNADNSFGVDGEYFLNVDDSGYLFQEDGKILIFSIVGPEISIRRILSDGQLDTGYGNSGTISFQGQGQTFISAGGQFRPDGSLLVSAKWNENGQPGFSYMKLDPNGLLDLSFGDSGFLTLTYDNDGLFTGIDIYDDNRFVVVLSKATVYPPDPALILDTEVMRYSADGNLDTEFGNNGIKEIPGYGFFPILVNIQENSRILIGGRKPFDMQPEFHMVRLYNSGVIDQGFIGDAYTDFQCLNVIETIDNKILATGNDWSDDLILIQFNNSPLNIEEFNQNIFKLVPNPTSGMISIHSDIEFLGESFSISDAHGREIYQGAFPFNNTTIDLSFLTSGLYYFTTLGNTVRFVIK